MSRPIFVLGAGLVLNLLTGVLAWAGLAMQRWSLVVLGGWLLSSALLLVLLDSWRRVRSLRRYVRDQLRASVGELAAPRQLEEAGVPSSPAASHDDVVGTVRLLQAQYVGRLDRMQTALDDALEALRDHDQSSRS